MTTFNLKNNFDFIFVFVMSLLIFFVQKYYQPNLASFDFQAFQVWEYAATIHLLPYRDLFYPYGLLEFFTLSTVVGEFVKLLITGVISLAVYILLKEVFKSIGKSLFIYTLFMTFTYFFVGYDSYARYGILMAYAILLGYLISRKYLGSEKVIYVLGVLSSFIFSLVNDQGIYCYILTLTIVPFYLKGKGKKIRSVLFFITGSVAGLTPLVSFLLYQNILTDFISYLKYLPTINIFAKTPFFPSTKTISNVFAIGTLLFASGYFGKILITPWYRRSRTDIYALVIFTSLLLLEYKNTVRSIDWQLTFFAFILLILLTTRIVKKHAYLLACGLGIGILLVFLVNNQLIPQSTIPIKNNQAIQKVTSEIQILSQGKKINVYSYPGDPIFYVKLKQKPPFYFSLYEATPKDSQLRQINYIKDMKVQYVIINLNDIAIQDEVPNFIRARYLTRYIFTSFVPFKRIDEYLIMKKGKGDIFSNEKLLGIDYPTYLKHVDLKNLVNVFPAEQRRAKLISISHLPSSNNGIRSIVLSFANTITYNNTLQGKILMLTSKEGLKTSVKLPTCRLESCFVDLSFVPMFYLERVIVDARVI